jgi:hypothetical protein
MVSSGEKAFPCYLKKRITNKSRKRPGFSGVHYFYYNFPQRMYFKKLYKKHRQSPKDGHMPVKVLVADENLDVHELVNDILLINYKDVAVDRVLEAEGFRAKLGAKHPGYNLIIIGSGLADASGKSAISILCEEFPQYRGAAVILQQAAGQIPNTPMAKKIPVLAKPYSLDEFSDCIKKICPR